MDVACTMAVILELEKRGKLPFKAIFQQLGKYFCTPIMKSFVLQVQGDLLIKSKSPRVGGVGTVKLDI